MPKKNEEQQVIDFTDVEEEEQVAEENEEGDGGGSCDKVYYYTDPEWTEYVLAHVSDEEMFGGMPKVDTLRRLVEKFIGRIVGTDIDFHYHFSPADGTHVAVALAKVFVENADGEQEVYTGVADATRYNTDPVFGKYLSAMAETRAKGRAYKEALRLQGVVSQEEAGFNERAAQAENLTDDPLNSSQLMLLKKMSKDLNINVQKTTEKMFGKSMDFDSMTTQYGVQLIKALNNYISGKEPVPEDLLN